MIEEIFHGVVEYLVGIIGSAGYFGVFFLMLLESSFFPFPSEVVLIPAGVLVARGEMTFIGVLISSTVGSLAGALVNYYLALYLGRRIVNSLIVKFGKIFFIKQKHVDSAETFFHNHGEISTFLGRLIPVVRQMISIPAGYCKMNLGKFAILTCAGAAIWSSILIYIGIVFGENQEAITSYLFQIKLILILVCVIGIGIYALLKMKKKIV